MAHSAPQITVQFGTHPTPAPMAPEHLTYFIRGEIPPAIADRYLDAGMPRRGLIRALFRIYEGGTVRVVGPNLVRRAGTLSSAR